MRRPAFLCLAIAVALAGCGEIGAATAPEVVVGVMLPMHGPQAALASEMLRGIQVAAANTNQQPGPRISLQLRDVVQREDVGPAVASLKKAGAAVIIGTYSSQLSIPAAEATSSAGLVYWESGSVADQLTGEGLPRVFRVGASGTNLGRGSAVFAAEQLAPRLRKPPAQVRVAVVEEKDAYGDSVAGAAEAELGRRGVPVTAHVDYNAYAPDWNRVLDAVQAARPDVVVLVSYVTDGIAFRRAMLARGLRVGALIGSTMAECGPDFGRGLGADAIGVFASDRPTAGFNPSALDPQGRAAYDVLARAFQSRWQKLPDDNAIEGFSAAWALFHEVLAGARGLDPVAIAAAAKAQDLPAGRLPNGAGLKFGEAPTELGQNLRAASVVWQWQGVNHSVTVWPPVFATGQVQMVPLPR